MTPAPEFKNGIGTLWYRIKRYPGAAAISLLLALLMAILLCYITGRLYPDFKLFNTIYSKIFTEHGVSYNFYSGEKGGTYYKIGEVVKGHFGDDGDAITNCPTGGGYDNAMKVTIEGNSFGLIQQEMLKDNDQLSKEVRVVAPIFLERIHILYKKALLKDFVNGDGVLQLTRNMSVPFLRHFCKVIRRINVGPVGSATQVLSSYVLQSIDDQIDDQLHTVPKYHLLSEAFETAFFDNTLDIQFYAGADPIDDIRSVLDSGQYALMSVSPSFITGLNKDFGLNLRVADFKDKYGLPQADNISTIGTLAYLIASKSTPDDDILRMLKRIDTSKQRIARSLIRLSVEDTSSYSDKGRFVMPLSEFGFFKSFNEEYEASRKIKGREVFTFLLSVIGLFFPVLKSMTGLGSAYNAWYCNKQIDLIGDQDSGRLLQLKAKVTDLYGDGNLLEVHYKRLIQRIAMYLERIEAAKKAAPSGATHLVMHNKLSKLLKNISQSELHLPPTR